MHITHDYQNKKQGSGISKTGYKAGPCCNQAASRSSEELERNARSLRTKDRIGLGNMATPPTPVLGTYNKKEKEDAETQDQKTRYNKDNKWAMYKVQREQRIGSLIQTA